jgi:hypothetical protein
MYQYIYYVRYLATPNPFTKSPMATTTAHHLAQNFHHVVSIVLIRDVTHSSPPVSFEVRLEFRFLKCRGGELIKQFLKSRTPRWITWRDGLFTRIHGSEVYFFNRMAFNFAFWTDRVIWSYNKTKAFCETGRLVGVYTLYMFSLKIWRGDWTRIDRTINKSLQPLSAGLDLESRAYMPWNLDFTEIISPDEKITKSKSGRRWIWTWVGLHSIQPHRLREVSQSQWELLWTVQHISGRLPSATRIKQDAVGLK